MHRGRFSLAGCRLLLGLVAGCTALPAFAGQGGGLLFPAKTEKIAGDKFLFPAKTQSLPMSPGVQSNTQSLTGLTSAAFLNPALDSLNMSTDLDLLQQNQLFTNPIFNDDKVDDTSPHPGLNQWDVGVPLVQEWGVAGSRTTLEFIPAISFFTEDENPFANDHLVREPLMRLGAQLSRDVIKDYLSFGVDVNYVHGGETQVQGVTQGARQSYRTVGVNASGKLTRQLGWSVEYSRAQSDEQGLEETDWYRLNLNYSF